MNLQKSLRTDERGGYVDQSSGKGSGRDVGVAPVVLTILDGWGHRNDSEHNAIRQGDTPVMEALWHAYPHTLIPQGLFIVEELAILDKITARP